jgi:ubiquinone/menaquinone biosynthesis C-methylase UbiE
MDVMAEAQRRHYNRIADAYAANLGYLHTQEYMAALDRALEDAIGPGNLGDTAELCCGHGEALKLLGKRISRYTGFDVSENMLAAAVRIHRHPAASFVQGDATQLPLANACLDTVIVLGGIHHVPDRQALFREISRVLRPGGRLIYREPVSDLWVWRLIRGVIYRVSPMLDSSSERPLTYGETVPVLEAAGLSSQIYETHGFLGFCFFMNSDVLFFNRLFRFLPGIKAITRAAAEFDRRLLSLRFLQRCGLQVIGVAVKPAS